MAADQASTHGPTYEVETVRRLAELMTEHDLSEIDLEHGPDRLRLRRGPRDVVSAAPTGIAAAESLGTPAAACAAPDKNLTLIKSEAIGTFYARPKPEADAFVKVGAKVTPTTVVGLIEAMKLFNEVQAGCSGMVVEVCVDNQQAVEYGSVLFKVDPAG